MISPKDQWKSHSFRGIKNWVLHLFYGIFETCILTRYLPISVDPDRCWLPYGAGPPGLPFLTCEERKRREKEGRKWKENVGKGRSFNKRQKTISELKSDVTDVFRESSATLPQQSRHKTRSLLFSYLDKTACTIRFPLKSPLLKR